MTQFEWQVYYCLDLVILVLNSGYLNRELQHFQYKFHRVLIMMISFRFDIFITNFLISYYLDQGLMS